MGDEGGYAPNLKKDEDALKVIVQAISEAGYKPGEDFKIAIDAASSEWWDEEQKCYIQPKSGKKLTQQQLVNMWKKFADTYPIISLEDGMAETDWEGWAMLTKAIGDRSSWWAMTCSSPTWSAWPPVSRRRWATPSSSRSTRSAP